MYILCAEGLSAIIRRNEEVGLIHRCTIARGAPSISHLLFADDCYFFSRAVEAEACTMKSPNTGRAERTKVCKSLGVQEINRPGKYLGMPMFVGRNKNDVSGFLVDRVGQRLQGWNNTLLSKVGKLVLLKIAAQAILSFWMSLFLLRGSVCNIIEKQMNGFWWGGRGRMAGVLGGWRGRGCVCQSAEEVWG